ncbi:MAG: hypothetical protein WBY67_12775 [Pseudolabrys sp.]|jgi:hypothetical protein
MTGQCEVDDRRSRYTAEVAVVASLARNVIVSVWGLFDRRYQ